MFVYGTQGVTECFDKYKNYMNHTVCCDLHCYQISTLLLNSYGRIKKNVPESTPPSSKINENIS